MVGHACNTPNDYLRYMVGADFDEEEKVQGQRLVTPAPLLPAPLAAEHSDVDTPTAGQEHERVGEAQIVPENYDPSLADFLMAPEHRVRNRLLPHLPATYTAEEVAVDDTPISGLDMEEMLVRYQIVTMSQLNGFPEHPITHRFRLAFLDQVDKFVVGEDFWGGIKQAITRVHNLAKVDKIVCFGLSSLFKADHVNKAARFVMELAVVYSLRERIIIARKANTDNVVDETGGEVPIYFQDPVFCNADIRLLQALGGIVLKNNHASYQITPNTMVVAVHLSALVTWDLVLRNYDPMVYIGNSVPKSSAYYIRAATRDRDYQDVGEVTEASRRFLATHHSAEITGMEEVMHSGSFFCDEYIYWRKEEGDEFEADDGNEMANLARYLSDIDVIDW